MASNSAKQWLTKCLYYWKDVALLIYTDEGILIGPKPGDLDAIIVLLKAPVTKNGKQTHRAFNITDEGTLDEYLGVKVEHLPNGTIKLPQLQLIQQILDDLGINGLTATKDSPAASTVRLHRDVSRKPYTDNWHHRSIIGKLNFLEKSTRPDIACAVHQCARFCLEQGVACNCGQENREVPDGQQGQGHDTQPQEALIRMLCGRGLRRKLEPSHC
jgi:hypothetical protein